MVMDFTVFNTNLHMINHYRRVNSAKSVVNTSAPRSYQLRYKNVSNLSSRYSTPSLMSTSERNPSRANSNCEVRKRKISAVKPVTPGERSSSVPPRPCTRRNQNVIPQNYIKTKNPCPKINYNKNTKIKIPIRDEMPKSSALCSITLSPKLNLVGKPEKKINSDRSKSPTRKAPIPAPRAALTAPKTAEVQDYEYLQFSLRITEDIIRNDLYSQKEMRRVFNSHVEANRGRLNMTKMLRQIDHLCRELEISKKGSRNNKEMHCLCETKENAQTKESNSNSGNSSQNSKKELLKKIADGKYEISEEEIYELTEYDLQNVISGILNNDTEMCPVCNQNNEPEVSPKLTEITPDCNNECAKLDDQEIYGKKSSDLNLNVIHSNIENFNCLSADTLKYNSSSGSVKSKNSEKEEKCISCGGISCCSCENKENQKDNEQEKLEDNKIIKKTSSETISDNLNPDIVDTNIIAEKISSKTISDDLNKTKSLEEKLFEGNEVISGENKQKSQSSIGASDQLLKSMLNSLPKNLAKDESAKQNYYECKNINISSPNPVCTPKPLNESETAESPHYPPETSAGNVNVEICPLEPLCSSYKVKENEILLEMKLLVTQLAEEQNQYRDLSSPNSLCSGQNKNENEIVETEKSQLSIKEQECVCVWSDKKKSFEELNAPSLTKGLTKKDLCLLNPFCFKQITKENEIVETKHNQSEEQNKTVDLCTVDLFSSKQVTNANETVETKRKLSGVPSPIKEQHKTEDLCSLDPFCSKQMTNANETVETKRKLSGVPSPIKEQNKTEDLCSLDPFCSKQMTNGNETVETKRKLSGVPSPIKEQHKTEDLCSLDPFCSKQMTNANETVETKRKLSGVPSPLKEQHKTEDLCSLDPFFSKQMTNANETVETKRKLSGVPSPIKEQNKTEDLCSLDPFCSKLMTNGNKTVETKNQLDVSAPIRKQNNTVDLCSVDPFCSKLMTKENEVSIVAQKSPVDSVKSSASTKTVLLDSKTTQTSFTEKTKCVKNCHSCDFHSDSNVSSNSKISDSKVVYENDNKSNLDNVDSELKPNLSENENQMKEKNEFISSLTAFILDKTFSKTESGSSKKELQRKDVEKTCGVCSTNEEKSDFVSTVEKLINDRTNDLYQYCLPEKNKSVSSEIFSVSANSLDKYQTEYRKQFSRNEIPKIKRKNSVSNKQSESSISDGEISLSSSNSSLPKKLGNKIIRTSQPQILEHLKKYEQNKNRSNSYNSLSSCLCNYELKVFEENYENYVPKFRRSLFFPAAATQTSNTNFNPGFNDNLLSDGEIQNTSSETEDTKTEVSEI